MPSKPDDRLTILLVDDDDDCRMLVRDAIAQSRVAHTVYEARNGEEALDLLRTLDGSPGSPRPALIYLDVEMPRLDGLATLKRIKADPKLRDVPVVMMTGVSDAAHIREAAACGANSYTVKPTDAEQFLRTVQASTHYWTTIHQYPGRRLASAA